WAELEALLDRAAGRGVSRREQVAGARLAALYRRACEHLALARARAYPAYMIDRLERMTANAHQLIYQRREIGLAQAVTLVGTDFPSSVRAHAPYVGVSAATFLVPMIVLGFVVYLRPELILSVVSSETVASFESMYSPAAASIGRTRDATTDWVMFAF